MAESTSSKSGGGCFSKLLFLILLLAAGGFATAVYFVSRPQDLSDLSTAAEKANPPRELKTVLRSAIDRRDYAVPISEAEINQWLARTLTLKQGGLLAGKVSLDRVWVRLENGHAEVIMSRTVMGKPFTVSMYLQAERMEDTTGTYTEIRPHGGPFHPDFPKLLKGGRFGQLEVPQGFLLLVMPAYEKLAALFPEEIELAFKEMSRIRIEEGRLILDPREPLGHQGMPGTF